MLGNSWGKLSRFTKTRSNRTPLTGTDITLFDFDNNFKVWSGAEHNKSGEGLLPTGPFTRTNESEQEPESHVTQPEEAAKIHARMGVEQSFETV